jgi:hypothetical protein
MTALAPATAANSSPAVKGTTRSGSAAIAVSATIGRANGKSARVMTPPPTSQAVVSSATSAAVGSVDMAHNSFFAGVTG